MVRIAGVALLCAHILFAADSTLLFSRTLGNDASISSIAVDPTGNILVAGGTSSFDFPVTNGSTNSGTGLSISEDSGRTWKPLGNLPAGSAFVLAADASTPPQLFAGGTAGVFRSVDGGRTWNSTAAFPGLDCVTGISPVCGVSGIAADPVHPGVVLAATSVGIYRTADRGATWQRTPTGVTDLRTDYIFFHPRDPNLAFTMTDGHLLRSTNGGISWSEYTSPFFGGGLGGRRYRIAFDQTDTRTVYQAGPGGVFRSTDAGQTWIPLVNNLFTFAEGIVADPSTPGLFYVSNSQKVYKTRDGGATWETLQDQIDSFRVMAVDPFRPSVIFVGLFRSEDSGSTFSSNTLGRQPDDLLFDRTTPGRLWATAPVGSDGFVAKLDPSGQQILFASYFEGTANDNLNKIASDPLGNIYVLGTRTSVTLSLFAAKFDSGGRLVYNVPIASNTVNNQPGALAAGPDGSIAVTSLFCEVTKLDPDGKQVFSRQLTQTQEAQCGALAVDRDGSILIGGRMSQRGSFPVTPDALQPQQKNDRDGIFARLDFAGNVRYATFFGATSPPFELRIDGRGSTSISGVAVDPDGNIVLAGSTATIDFPTTSGAYQREFRANCPYPSSSAYTGFIGTIVSFQMDDVFVTRLNPQGTQIVSSTLLGGDCLEYVTGLAVDADGNAWVTGLTDSNPFPQVSPFQAGPAVPNYSAFVSKLSPSGQLLLSSYTVGGDRPSIAVDRAGTAWVAGSTRPAYSGSSGSPFGPVTPPPSAGYLARIGVLPTNILQLTGAGNLFTGRNGPISPGEYALVTLDGFDPGQYIHLGWTPTAPLPRQLAGVQVLFDGEPAALFSVGRGYAEFIAPYALKGKVSTVVQVVHNGRASTALRVNVADTDVAFLTPNGAGTGRASARNEDGTLNEPSNPASPGSAVTFFFTGAGVADASCPEGSTAQWGSLAPQHLVNFSAETEEIRVLPGFLCGLFQVRIRVPANAPSNPETPIYLNGPTLRVTFSVR